MANDYQSLRKLGSKFKFAKKGYRIKSGTKEAYSNLLKRYLKIHKSVKKYHKCFDTSKNDHENIKRTKVSEKIIDKSLDFYKQMNVVLQEFVTALFHRPNKDRVYYMYKLFQQLNHILQVCFYFDHDRNKYESLFHDFSLRKTLTSATKNYTHEYIFQTSVFCACSIPMATLFVTQFVSQNKYLKNDFNYNKEAMLLNKQRKRFLFLICCIFRKEGSLKYCFLFFSGVYCNYYESEYIEYIAKELDGKKYKYFSDMKKV